MKLKILLACAVVVISVGLFACNKVVEDKVTLDDTTWALESYGERGNLQVVLEGTEITAVFNSSKGLIQGSSGCNSYGGVYQVTGNNLTIPEVENTEMDCLEPAGVMEQEERYLRILPTVESYEISDGKLQIFAGTRVLVFKPTDNGKVPTQGFSVEISYRYMGCSHSGYL